MPTQLVPVKGCWVRRRNTRRSPGMVVALPNSPHSNAVLVRWPDGRREWTATDDLESGFQLNWSIQDVPASATRKSLGEGKIIGRRRLGSRDQLLVQLNDSGRSVWLPYENSKRIKDVRWRYVRTDTSTDDHAERLRLRLLAHELENWNHLTGALDRLDVDPLPHQIQLVHRILSSGNYNWLIADDVGLGKTIEVGLLLAALKRKRQARRVLIVSPAGIVRQWQDELLYKFDQKALIYGRDFHVNQPTHWKQYDQVIVSIDLAKRTEHLEVFRQADGWDIVVFDEGHKLTRHADGERTERYRLAEVLRRNADAFLLLSGTPHQGYQDRFMAILDLVRPDLQAEIHTLEANPEIVSDMILRNRKTEVTDANGQFIFKGLKVHRVAIEPSEHTRRFQRRLREYLVQGYRAGEGIGPAGRAIGFVMTTYRKLSSSSIAAIERGLQRRLERILQSEDDTERREFELTLDDLSEGGDDQDDLALTFTGMTEFFTNEREVVEDLLEYAKFVRQSDEKLRVFVEHVVAPTVESNNKLLIFTEYRATQIYLKEALEREFPAAGTVTLINGSMSLDQKLESIEEFNSSARFMISTEAGGEGINLHQSCHVMVNYDLPWNPSRLVQRTGRLYRYGQSETVVVFNLHARDSFDNKALDLMMQRVEQIVQDMAPVGKEFNDRLHAEILGEVLESLDVADILRSATEMEIAHTNDQISAALDRAREARQLQDEIFQYVSGYDPNALGGTIGFTMRHVDAFFRGMLPILGIDLEAVYADSARKRIRLPERLRGMFPEFGNRTSVVVTTERQQAQRDRNVVLLDFETPFFRYLINQAKLYSFGGQYASTRLDGQSGVLAVFKLRWQNDQGAILTEDLVPLFLTASGSISENPLFLPSWMVSEVASDSASDSPRPERERAYDELLKRAELILSRESTRFKHPNGIVEIAAADFNSL